MRIVLQIISLFSQSIALFALYTQISGIKMKWSRYLLAALGLFSTTTALAIIETVVKFKFIFYIGLLTIPLYFLFFSIITSASIPKYLSMFYGLFPTVLWNLQHRLISFFLMNIFGWNNQKQMDTGNYLLYISAILASLLSILLPRLLRYDFKRLTGFKLSRDDKRLIIFLNISMIVYYMLVQLFAYLEKFYQLSIPPYREMIVIFYIILFFSSANILDRNLRERIQQELSHQKEIQLQNMADYSQHIEDLYNELRGFRHDYINILTSLRLGIENQDLPAIQRVYNQVLKDSGQPLNQPKFDLGRLSNIKNDALKSLLSAKFLEAQNKQIMAGIEVPQPIEPQGMGLLDILTVLSILTDNAIEAAIEAQEPALSIACLQQEGKQVFIVENSTQKNVVDTSKIFERGISSKGKNRGIGLSNVQKIISRYPNVSLRTISHDYHFRQELEIKLSSNK